MVDSIKAFLLGLMREGNGLKKLEDRIRNTMKTKPRLIRICLLYAAIFQAVTAIAQPVIKVAAGYDHTLFLKSDGSLWAMGANWDGQLGDGVYGRSYVPSTNNRPELIVASNVVTIAAGGYHSLFIKRGGSLWAVGANDVGQLGDGTYNNTNRPEQIVASNVVAIAGGVSHTLFLKSDGSLWAMGANQYGQLGDGTQNSSNPYYGTNLPELIVASNVTAIAAGYWHSLFIKSDGSLWGMGYNGDGELGDSTWNNTDVPEELVSSNVMAISAGSAHSLFLKTDGSLWGTGWEDYGQLGDGISGGINTQTNRFEQIVASNVTAIVAGDGHSLFLKNDGSLWDMGDNEYGQLGDGTYNNTNRPEKILAGGVTEIAGFDQSLFLKSDGSLWAMGYNYDGELGDGANSNTNRPEQIVAGIPGYNQIFGKLLSSGDMQLSFVGIAGTNYALDRSTSLSSANWVPQQTNPAGAGGILIFTNTPDTTTNNFWRIRSVP